MSTEFGMTIAVPDKVEIRRQRLKQSSCWNSSQLVKGDTGRYFQENSRHARDV